MPLLTITNLSRQRLGTRGSFGPVGPEEQRAKDMTVAEIEQLRPLLIKMEAQGLITWDVGGYDLTDPDAEFITAEDVANATTPVVVSSREANYVVGNALAGDTLDECDFLDPGDGTGIEAALNAAFSSGPAEIYIRAGNYDFDQPSSPTLPFFLGSSTKIRGAGIQVTNLLGSSTQRSMFNMFVTTTFSDISFIVPGPTGSPTGAFFIDCGFAPVVIKNVTISGATSPGDSLNAIIGGFFPNACVLDNILISCSGTGPAGFVNVEGLFFDSQLNRLLFLNGDNDAIRLNSSLMALNGCGGQARVAFQSGFFASQISIQGGVWRCRQAADLNNGFPSGVLFSGVLFEGAPSAISPGFDIDSAFAQGVSISGCIISGGWATGVNIGFGASNTLLVGNRIRGLFNPVIDNGTNTLPSVLPGENLLI